MADQPHRICLRSARSRSITAPHPPAPAVAENAEARRRRAATRCASSAGTAPELHQQQMSVDSQALGQFGELTQHRHRLPADDLDGAHVQLPQQAHRPGHRLSSSSK
ncbi:MAG: hypothetical protein R2864_08220 [Syntrophotaleaceae bacterium]